MLPNRNGFELAAEIRARGWDVPVIFLTAKGQTEDVVNGFRIGGNDYIRKPFSMEELIVRIENVLRVKREDTTAKQPDVLVMGHYRLQVNKQLLCRGEEEKRLSYREAELLKYLWVHRNTIIDRAGLLNEIWGNDSFFNSRNLDVYITKLRSYLKDDPRLEIITVKGVGYRFITE
jgi:DNA-binding response OmpR family regulator